MSQIDEIVERIVKSKKDNQTYLVAIDGFGGAGKSTFAKKLQEKLPDSVIVQLDDFYSLENKEIDRRIIPELLEPLRKNQIAKYQKFNWKSEVLDEWREIAPGRIIILEGTYVLYPEFGNYDLSIWIDMPVEQAAHRGLNRDLIEYHIDTRKDWQENWIPHQRRYFAQFSPQLKADVIVSM